MENFKIYKNGKYDTLQNVKMKAKPIVKGIIEKVDDFFVNH